MTLFTSLIIACMTLVANADTQHSANAHKSADTHQSADKHRSADKHQSASERLQSLQDRVQTGRQHVEKALGNMASRQTELIAMSKDESQLQSMAGSIQTHVSPTLSTQQRKSLENDYQSKLYQIRNFDSSSACTEEL